MKEMIKQILIGLAMLLAVIALPLVAMAGFLDVGDLQQRTAINSPKDFSTLATNILKFALSLVGIIAVAAIIYGGFLYITSLGDDKKAQTGKNIILYTVVGIIIIGLAGLIANIFIKMFTK